MIEKLKKLGLSNYESRAYLALLKLGNAEAGEIALNAKIPMGRIYNVLSSLEEARMIRTQETRPKIYGCVEPAAALPRLSKNKQEEFKQKAAQIETLVRDIVSELSCIGQKETGKTFWTVAKGDEALELVRECILGAQKELLYFYASRTTLERIKKDVVTVKYSGIMDTLHESLKKGVEIKIIANKDVDISSLEEFPAVKRLFTYMGGKFDVRLAAIPATPFDIIDGETVLLQMLNPLNPMELYAVINIRDPVLAEELRKNFFTIWEKAQVYSVKT